MDQSAMGARQLRPMGVTDLIDATFTLYRANFALFAGVVAVLSLPQIIINMILASLTPTTNVVTTGGNLSTAVDASRGVIASSGGSGLIGLVFTILITGALAQAVAARYLDRPETIAGAYTSLGAAPFIRLFLALLLAVVAFTAAVLVIILVFVVAALVLGTVAVVVGVIVGIAAIPATVYVATHLYLVPQAIVLERRGVIDSFRRSWFLVHGYFWHVFGLVFLVGLMIGVLSGVVGAVVGIFSLGNVLAATALVGVLNILLQPISLGAVTLLYFDQRVRKEGFDLELAAGNVALFHP